jgi:hypothetical protein
MDAAVSPRRQRHSTLDRRLLDLATALGTRAHISSLMRIERLALRRALDVPEEPGDGHVECLSDRHQSRSTQAVRADFIFLDLLGGNSYRPGELRLRHAEHSPALSNLPSNRLVDGRRSARLHAMGWLDTTLH